jgi:hypothetical protein
MAGGFLSIYGYYYLNHFVVHGGVGSLPGNVGMFVGGIFCAKLGWHMCCATPPPAWERLIFWKNTGDEL